MGRQNDGGQSGEDRIARRVGKISLAKIGARKVGPPDLRLDSSNIREARCPTLHQTSNNQNGLETSICFFGGMVDSGRATVIDFPRPVRHEHLDQRGDDARGNIGFLALVMADQLIFKSAGSGYLGGHRLRRL